MSVLSDELLKQTSKGVQQNALLVLEDGTTFWGRSCGAPGETFGEICFNTSLVGYLEVITDPSYAGQLVTFTYPQIGNYGVNIDDAQSNEIALRGVIVHDMCFEPSNFRSTCSLPEYLQEQGVVAIEGIDTRALVRHIREQGAMRAGISTFTQNAEELLEKVRQSSQLVGTNLVQEVSCSAGADTTGSAVAPSRAFALNTTEEARYHVVAYDCGVKQSILDELVRVGCSVHRVPWNTSAEEVMALHPDGVFLSNGPGDPDAVEGTYEQVKKLIGKVPLFGICLGHQMISKAVGGTITKLKYGHRGGNQPVMNLLTQRVEITAQNHGFNLDFSSLGELIPELSGGQTNQVDDLRFWVKQQVAPIVNNQQYGRIQLTHVNLNDGTAEGIAFLDAPVFSVQYHPEASPGPTDAHYLFTAFTRLMDGNPHYLDIDSAQDRLVGWRF